MSPSIPPSSARAARNPSRSKSSWIDEIGESINITRAYTNPMNGEQSLAFCNKVTLHAASGLQVTATTASGVAEVVYMDGTASGSMCRVRFA